MSTETKAAVEVVVNTSTKVVEGITTYRKSAVETEGKFNRLAQVIQAEASRLGYDKKQARQMVVLSWRESAGFKSTDQAEITAFDQKYSTYISKVMTLAYPKSPEAVAEYAKVVAFNDKAGSKKDRIGANTQLEVARGNITFEQALAGKADSTPTKTTQTKASAEESKISPDDAFAAGLAILMSNWHAKGVTLDTMQATFDSLMADWREKEAKAQTKAPAAQEAAVA